ncbi:MAG: hypothetical protein ACT6RD_00925 [Brevundimonas sp.]|uniref:hypothetical protein n=1 Tax=Brevundimonas sp. TaxID=1871086 RepID=UPI0040344804
MITSGVEIVAADGLHDDGWCWPQVKMRIRTQEPASEVRIGVWLKPEETGQSRTLFTFGSEGAVAKAEFVPLDHPVELSIPVSLTAGEEMGLRISTPHRASRGDDARDLSFIMMSVVAL